MQKLCLALTLAVLAAAGCGWLQAQSRAGWLRYAIPPDPPRYHGLPHAVVLLGDGAGNIAPEEQTAADELDRGLGHMVAGTDVVLHRFDLSQDAIILGTTDALHRARLGRHLHGWVEKPLPEEGFRIVHLRRGIREWYVLQGSSPRAELWAAFRFAALVAEDQQLPQELIEAPHFSLRALDMGSAAELLPLLEAPLPGRATDGGPPGSDFARLLASVGLNTVIADANAAEARRLRALLQPYGLRLQVAARNALTSGSVLHIPASSSIGELRTMLGHAAAQARVLRTTGDTLLLEGALGQPFGDASAQGSIAMTQQRADLLRTTLEPNVIVASEAVPRDRPLLPLASPNFGLLPSLSQAAVLPILPVGRTLLAYPAPAWFAQLHTPQHGANGDTTLADLLADTGGGVIGTLSAAQAATLLQQPLLHANLYAFGRLAWAPTLSPESLTEEWARQTWGDDAREYAVAAHILLVSGSAAQAAAAPLGMPWLTDAAGNPAPARMVQAAQKPFASSTLVGIEQTSRGDVHAYPATFADILADPLRCPLPVLLLFHRLPWHHALPDGKSLAQQLYDTVFSGAAAAGNAVDAWETTQGIVDQPRYAAVHAFLQRSAMHTDIVRDVTAEWVQTASGVRDALGFVGSHPGRVAATDLQHAGFAAPVSSSAAHSDAATLPCPGNCTATLRFEREANVYRITVAYRHAGGGIFHLLVNGDAVGTWSPGPDVPGELPQQTPAMDRFTVNGVRLRPGDTVSVCIGVNAGAVASLDFLEITRDPRWN